MNPIWDYVKKVERHLPAARRTEVAGALYATLKARKETMEKAKGAKATDAEKAAVGPTTTTTIDTKGTKLEDAP